MSRILLAEDDDSLRGFPARALERAGYEVTVCADGEEAMAALAAQEPYDLLLTDIVMPGVDGIEVAREAAARQPSLRIMFITGFAAVALSAGTRAPGGQGAVQTRPPARDRRRGGADDGRLACKPEARPIWRCALPRAGRVAQRESTSLTSRGSQVQSLSRPPSFPLANAAYPASRVLSIRPDRH